MMKITNQEINFKNADEFVDNIRKQNVKIIFFGETHGILPEEEIIELLIKHTNPEILLYELLEEEKLFDKTSQEKFLLKPDELDFSIISKYEELKPIVNLAKKYSKPIIGCDIKNMCRQNKDFLKNYDEQEELKIMKEREEKQREIVESTLKDNNLILVIVGAYHLRKESALLDKLNFNNTIIMPEINGRQLEEFDPEMLQKKYVLKYKYQVNTYD